jgi:hypothetical protein
MNRELKFRAFANGKMRYDVTGFEHGEVIGNIHEPVNRANFLTPNNKKMEANCAFQYYLNDGTMICDKAKITLGEAKLLWNQHYADMVEKTRKGYAFEAAVWINGNERTDYGETLVHVHNPELENGVMFETTRIYFRPFEPF